MAQATMSGDAGKRDLHHAVLLLLRPTHHRRLEILDRRRADLLHDRAQLDAQQVEHPLDPRLAEGAETPDIRAPDTDALRAHRQRLDDVGAAAKTAVDQDRDATAHRLDDLGQRVDGGAAAVLAA